MKKGCNKIKDSKVELKNKFRDVLDGKDVDITPVGTVTTSGVLELMDISGASRPEADRDPEKMAQLAGSLYTSAKLEIVRFPFDVTVLGQAMGCEIDPGTKARTPSIMSHPFKNNPQDICVPSDLLERGRIPVILEAARILSNKEGKYVPCLAGLEGPADLASYLCGIKPLMLLSIKKPELVSTIIDKCVEACIEYANACIDAGADAVVIADAMASPDMVGPDVFRQLIRPGLQRIAANIKGYRILHICGKVDSILPDMMECGFHAISIEESVDIKKAIKLAHEKKVAVIGNISPAQTLYDKSTDKVISESISCLENNIDILAPGCGVAPETPLKNLHAMVKARNMYHGLEK